MSVKEKLHKLMKVTPFWADLADSIDQELILFQQDRVLPQKNFFEPRTLDASNFYDPNLFPSFDNYASYLIDFLGFSPFSELRYSKVLPALQLQFPLSGALPVSFFNTGWQGGLAYSGNNSVPLVFVEGVLTLGLGNYLNFDGSGVGWLNLASDNVPTYTPYVISTDAAALLFDYVPPDQTTAVYTFLRLHSGGSNSYISVSSQRVYLRLDTTGTITQVNFKNPLVTGQSYRIGLRFRGGVLDVFVDGSLNASVALSGVPALPGVSGTGITGTTYSGSLPPSTITVDQIGTAASDGVSVPFSGQVGRIIFYHEALGDLDFADEYVGKDLSESSLRLNRPDSLNFMKAEAKGFGFRIENRGNENFYLWVLNKGKMIGRPYQLYRDVTTNTLIKSITDPIPSVITSLTNPVIEPFFAGATSFNAVNKLDAGLTLDQGSSWTLDQNFTGKNVAPTKHFALEFVIGRGRNDFENSTFPRFMDYSELDDAYFLQKHLDYLTREVRFGRTTTEFPHVGAQLLLACSRHDTSPRIDLYTRTSMTISGNFPLSSAGWTPTLFQTVKVYSSKYSVNPLYQRGILSAEVDFGSTWYLINLMLPALAVGPVVLTGTSGQTSYSTTLSAIPIKPGSLLISFTDTVTGNVLYLRDDAQGHVYYSHIVPDVNHWSGTIDYLTGNLTFQTFVTAGPTFIAGWNGSTAVSYNVATSAPININYKTGADVPIDKIELWDVSSLLLTIQPKKIYFHDTSNHLSCCISVDLS